MGVLKMLYVVPFPSSDFAVAVWPATVQEEKRWGKEEVVALFAVLIFPLSTGSK